MDTYAYVDGFNLYYRLLRKPNRRWLDLSAMLRRVYPDDNIIKVRYFTAKVKPFASDPSAPQRQQMYLRALGTLPDVEIHYGYFQVDKKWRPLVTPLADGTKFVEVFNPEEKGSDVNLASHLIHDASTRAYEKAVVLTGDADLAEPIRLVVKHMGCEVSLLYPTKAPSGTLLRAGPTEVQKLRVSTVLQCQFPDTLTDATGTFRKPGTW